MGKMTRYTLIYGALLFAVWALSGCYTQLETAGSDSGYAEREEYRGTDIDTAYTDSSGYSDEEYEHARTHFYYDSYYPAFTFGVGYGYYSPWYGRPYWGYGYYYDPFAYYYYSPWAWGPYGSIYEPGWWYPHYGGSYATGRYNAPRNFGNSRMIGSTRRISGGYTVGASRAGASLAPGAVSRPSGSLSRPSINSGRVRQTSPLRSPAPRMSTTRRQGERVGMPSRSGTVNQGRVRRNSGGRYVAPSASPRGGGERSYGGGRSYSPPASHSAPAPASRGGSSGGRQSGGSRQGGHRR